MGLSKAKTVVFAGAGAFKMYKQQACVSKPCSKALSECTEQPAHLLLTSNTSMGITVLCVRRVFRLDSVGTENLFTQAPSRSLA